MRALAMLVAVTMACGPSTAPSATPSPVAVTAAIATAARTATAPPTTAPVSPTASPAPTPTPLDARTAALVARLKEWCGDPRGSITQVFEVIGRLADGRSANELVSVLGGPSCVLRSFAAGDGATEWVTISAYRDTGALLWVDRGFWRIAPVPSEGGYLWPSGDRSVGPRRELLMAIDGGGSGGAMGVLVVEIADAGARVALDTGRTGVSHLGASFVDDELLLVSGRKLPDRPWGIAANCCLPGGHEWLWRRTASGYVLVGERQDQSPYYALNALLGAIDANAPDLANDVATSAAITAARSAFGPGRFWTWRGSANASAQERAELGRWSLLPAASTIPPDPVVYEVARAEPLGPASLITFERIGGVWIATSVRPGTLP